MNCAQSGEKCTEGMNGDCIEHSETNEYGAKSGSGDNSIDWLDDARRHRPTLSDLEFVFSDRNRASSRFNPSMLARRTLLDSCAQHAFAGKRTASVRAHHYGVKVDHFARHPRTDKSLPTSPRTSSFCGPIGGVVVQGVDRVSIVQGVDRVSVTASASFADGE